jgi:hypothetical protein
MASFGTVHVEGLAQLDRAFKRADATLHRELRGGLKRAVEPVRSDAEQLAVSGITRIGLPWSRMRVGVTARSVYVAPKKRGSRGPLRKRPNLAPLLLGKAMLPALEKNQETVTRAVDGVLGEMERAWERA